MIRNGSQKPNLNALAAVAFSSENVIMDKMNQSSNSKLGVHVLKPICLFGACVAFAAIGLLIFYWIASDEEERLTIENRLTNKPPETSIVEKNNDSTDPRVIKPDRDRTENVTKRSASPDELILGMSRNELDAFHKKQMLAISEKLSNPQTKVELPPSDDILPPMTLRELDALHRQQTISSKKRPIEFVQPDGDGTTESKDAVMSLDELDLLHREQSIQDKSANHWVELPPVSTENEFEPLTLDQLDAMLSRQQLAADFNQVDDTKPIVLPPSSDGPIPLTNWDLIEIHVQQEKVMKQ